MLKIKRLLLFIYAAAFAFILTSCGDPEAVKTAVSDADPSSESIIVQASKPDAQEETQGETAERDAVEDSEAIEETLAETSEEDVPKTTTSSSEGFSFEDVMGIIYKVSVDPTVRKHDYNWENLTYENGRAYYEDENYTSLTGIDVSYFQGDIDWAAVKADGIDFVIIRLGYRGYGEGTLNTDVKALENIDGAHAAGLDVGVYFFSQAINEEEAEEEADYIMQVLDGRSIELPIVYDPEEITDDEARSDGITGDQLTRNTLAFCEKIEEYGHETMLYSNMKWEAYKFNLSQLSDIEIWYADYTETPQTPYHFAYWQYSETGSVAGIEGPVDMNIRFIKK